MFNKKSIAAGTHLENFVKKIMKHAADEDYVFETVSNMIRNELRHIYSEFVYQKDWSDHSILSNSAIIERLIIKKQYSSQKELFKNIDFKNQSLKIYEVSLKDFIVLLDEKVTIDGLTRPGRVFFKTAVYKSKFYLDLFSKEKDINIDIMNIKKFLEEHKMLKIMEDIMEYEIYHDNISAWCRAWQWRDKL
jgi:hypothetical protein